MLMSARTRVVFEIAKNAGLPIEVWRGDTFLPTATLIANLAFVALFGLLGMGIAMVVGP